MNYYIRIKPLDPIRGHILQRYTYKGICFDVKKGWYIVSNQVGEYLKTVHQIHGDLNSPMAFDVCTEDEAKALDAKEAEEEAPKRPADKARPVAASDEPIRKKRGRKPKAEKPKAEVPETEKKEEEEK